jgi:hypothetical protein
MKHEFENFSKRFENQNLRLEINFESLTAMAIKIKSKARFPKPEFNYRYRHLDQMKNHLELFIAAKENNQKRKQELLEKKKEALKVFAHPYKAGKILYESWGYEQTNLRYWQVIAVKGKSVVIRPIAKKEIASTSWASGMYEPMENEFMGAPIVKRIVTSVGYNGSVSYHISMGSSIGWLHEYKGEANYCSWYA